MKSTCGAITIVLLLTVASRGQDAQAKPHPQILLERETASRVDVFANYWDKAGVERGVHISCPSSQTTAAANLLSKLADAYRAYHGNVDGAQKLLSSPDPEAGMCSVMKRSFHYEYSATGVLAKVGGNQN